MSERCDRRTPTLPVPAVGCEEVGVLVGEQSRRPSCWGDDSPGPGAEDADPAEAGIAWMVVGMRPPAKGTAPRRADRVGATADADPGHGNGTNASGGSLRREGRDCRSIDVRVEAFGHRSGGLPINVRDSGRFHDQLALTNSVADVGS